MAPAVRIVLPRLSPFRATFRCAQRTYSSFSANERVELVYDHHEPPKSSRAKEDSPIIFMHGIFGSKKNNRTVSKVLARDLKRHVFAVDLRNHGESPHAPKHDYLSMASDVEGFIASQNLSKPTLIGHSMGAKVAMTLALSQPSLITDLVAVDNAPVDTSIPRSFASYVHGLRKIQEASVSRQTEADAIFSEFEKELPVRQFILGNLYREAITLESGEKKTVFKSRIPLDIIAKGLDHIGDFPFRDPNTTRFEKPALFIRGSKSGYVPDESIPAIGQFFPRFRLVDVEAGHWVISENPTDFLKSVIEFLTPTE
ncbi:alpha beta hydrolase fold family [Xylariaceae sp. FL1019]|nr:alpha beta hydrolase fold family [Xylariaceae sp. FL1019]